MKKDHFIGIRMPKQLVDEMNAIAVEINESLQTVIRSSCEIFKDIAGEQLAAYKIAKSNRIGDSHRLTFEGCDDNFMLFVHKQAVSDLMGLGKKAEDEVSTFFADAIKGKYLLRAIQPWPINGITLAVAHIDSMRVWCVVGKWQLIILAVFQ